ncbi:MAG: NADH:ubiquinone reductase (Na(+)-transporting) subunit C [Bacteroidales bacterium]
MTNRYIFIYASVMVIVVALILSGAATLLRPRQERNMRIEKMQNILASVGIQASGEQAEELYSQYITSTLVLNAQGEEIEGNAFDVDLQIEVDKDPEERMLPLFISEIEGQTYYIVPVRGSGLWGPIWGYVSLESDLSTIRGVNLDHSSETPGLGAEISQEPFEQQFAGKKIYNEQGEFTSVRVVKGGTPPEAPHQVDGISGGTITSNGVTRMMQQGLGLYEPYFNQLRTS